MADFDVTEALDIQNVATDNAISEFATYEDYLDGQISAVDLYYLEDRELARQLVELGYRGTGDPIKREEFEAKKKAAELVRLAKRQTAKNLSGANKDLKSSPFLMALAEREESNRSGKNTSIIFLRCKNNKDQEVSGYIDFSHRLKCENFESYFNKSKRLVPKPTDLSFYNWDTQLCTSNPTPNFQVISDNESGLLFKNKRDRKVINVDPNISKPGDNTTRTEVMSQEYIQIAIFDHITRRKT